MASRDPSRPNILFILSDDQGPWAMGCAGNSEVRTPNLDDLASRGMRFDNFFCASPVCSPARASILTGRIPSQHGVLDFLAHRGNGSGQDLDADGIEYLAGQPGYTDLLAERGYRCGLSGKWHLGVARRPQKSMEYWDVFALGSGPYYRSPMIRAGEAYRPDAYVSEMITDNGLTFLDDMLDAEEPFCLNVHYTAPHSPWERDQHPPDLFDDYLANCPFASVPDLPLHAAQLAKEGGLQVPGSGHDRRLILSGYFAATTAMDACIGRLVGWLDRHDLRKSTLVVFMSDNGMNMGHHGIWGKGNGTFPPNMYDTSVKVPAIFSQPGRIPEGRVEHTLLSQYDVFPTLLDYTGQPVADQTLPGISFATHLEGRAVEDRRAVVVYDEYGPTRMVRTTRWKYVHRYPYGPHELYDLDADPNEERNVVGDAERSDIVRELRSNLEGWFARFVLAGRDGVHEAVSGRGQLGLIGVEGDGEERFVRDVVFADGGPSESGR